MTNDPVLRDRLIAMAEADARLREELLGDGSLFEGYNPRMAELHARNAQGLAAIVDETGVDDRAGMRTPPGGPRRAPARDPRVGQEGGMDMMSGSVRAAGWAAAAVLALLGVPGASAAQEKEETVRAAAKLTGITSGMAMACGQDSKPVLHAYRDLLDRKRIFGAERDRLVKVVSTASDRGFTTQRQPGAMSCAEVRTQMQRAIRRLQRAR